MASGNSRAARSARAKLQWRDRFGRFVEMGRGIKFKLRFNNGTTQSVLGTFVGIPKQPTLPNGEVRYGQIYVSNDPHGLKDGFYNVQSSNGAEIVASLSDEQLAKSNIKVGKHANGTTISERSATDIQGEDTIAYTTMPEGWVARRGGGFQTEDGDFYVLPNPDPSNGNKFEFYQNNARQGTRKDWPEVVTSVAESDNNDGAPAANTSPAKDQAKAALKPYDADGSLVKMVDDNASSAEIKAALNASKSVAWTRDYNAYANPKRGDRTQESKDGAARAIKTLTAISSVDKATQGPAATINNQGIVNWTRDAESMSLDVTSGELTQDGYLVATENNSVDIPEADFYGANGPQLLADYVTTHKDDLGNGKRLAITRNSDTQTVQLDVVDHVETQDEATQLAATRNQARIYDVANSAPIDTGDTTNAEPNVTDPSAGELSPDDAGADAGVDDPATPEAPAPTALQDAPGPILDVIPEDLTGLQRVATRLEAEAARGGGSPERFDAIEEKLTRVYDRIAQLEAGTYTPENAPAPEAAPDAVETPPAVADAPEPAATPTPTPEPETPLEQDVTYRGLHQAPGNDEYNARLDDLATMYPADIYDQTAKMRARLYGSNHPDDIATIAIIDGLRGNPDKMVKVYRAAPEGATLNPGDWVTPSKSYAEQHMAGMENGDRPWAIIEADIPAKHLYTEGNSLMEWGFDPNETPAPVQDATPPEVTTPKVSDLTPQEVTDLLALPLSERAQVLKDRGMLPSKDFEQKGGPQILSAPVTPKAAPISDLKALGIPDEPGSTPIPEGHVRLFHYTKPDAIDSVKAQGLIAQEDGPSAMAQEPAMIWAKQDEPAGGRDQFDAKPVVEFHVPSEVWNSGPYPRNALTKSVSLDSIVAVHEPWHRMAREMRKRYTPEQIKAGALEQFRSGDLVANQAIDELNKGFGYVAPNSVDTAPVPDAVPDANLPTPEALDALIAQDWPEATTPASEVVPVAEVDAPLATQPEIDALLDEAFGGNTPKTTPTPALRPIKGPPIPGISPGAARDMADKIKWNGPDIPGMPESQKYKPKAAAPKPQANTITVAKTAKQKSAVYKEMIDRLEASQLGQSSEDDVALSDMVDALDDIIPRGATRVLSVSRDANGQITGILATRKEKGFRGAKILGVEQLYSSAPGNGAGSALMRVAAQEAIDSKSELVVIGALQEAKPFYARMGALNLSEQDFQNTDEGIHGFGRWSRANRDALAAGTPVDTRRSYPWMKQAPAPAISEPERRAHTETPGLPADAPLALSPDSSEPRDSAALFEVEPPEAENPDEPAFTDTLPTAKGTSDTADVAPEDVEYITELSKVPSVPQDFGYQDSDADYADEKFMPTAEQRDIVMAVLGGNDVAVQALAGTGKTSTLELIAKRMLKTDPNRRIIYIAFNTSVADEARSRMPSNVEVRTMDSLGWTIPKDITKKMNNQEALILPTDIARAFGIGNVGDMTSDDVVRDLQRAITAFTNSDRDSISEADFEKVDLPFSPQVLSYAQDMWSDINSPAGKLKFNNSQATKIWALTRPDLSQLSGGVKNPADVIFYDEAQDLSPVGSRVVREQSIQKVYVGDSNQAIYGFRGAENELDKAEVDFRLPLTQSWRFGPEIAGMGNRFLTLLGSKFKVVGGGKPGVVMDSGMMRDPDAILTRTNSGALKAILEQIDGGRVVGVAPKYKKELQSLVSSAQWLQNPTGKRPRLHDDLAGYRSWSAIEKDVAEEKADTKVTMLYNIVEKIGIGEVQRAIDNLREYDNTKEPGDKAEVPRVVFEDGAKGVFVADPNGRKPVTYAVVRVANPRDDGDGSVRLKIYDAFNIKDRLKASGFRFDGNDKTWYKEGSPESLARSIKEFVNDSDAPVDVVVTTAHKAKGLEWKRVKIGDDFWGPRSRVDPTTGEVTVEMPSPEEMRLAYVAVTRAVEALDPGSLNWVQFYTDDEDENPNNPVEDAPEADATPAPEPVVAPEPAAEPELTPEPEALAPEPAIDLIQNILDTKDTTPDERQSITDRLNKVDLTDKEARDIKKEVTNLPNPANETSKPRRDVPTPTPVDETLLTDNPADIVDPNLIMRDVKQQHPDFVELSNGDVVVDSRSFKNQTYEVIVRRTSRERFFAYMRVTDAAGNVRVSRISTDTHSYTALIGQMDRGKTLINRPNPAAAFKAQGKKNIQPLAANDFGFPDTDLGKYNANPELDAPANEQSEKIVRIIGQLAREGRSREIIDLVAADQGGLPSAVIDNIIDAVARGQLAVGGNRDLEIAGIPSHISYDGKTVVQVGDTVDWTDWKTTSSTYGQVFRGIVKKVRYRDNGANGKYKYSDTTYAVFPEYNKLHPTPKGKENSYQRSFVSSNMSVVTDINADIAKPFFAKKEEKAAQKGKKFIASEHGLPLNPPAGKKPRSIPKAPPMDQAKAADYSLKSEDTAVVDGVEIPYKSLAMLAAAESRPNGHRPVSELLPGDLMPTVVDGKAGYSVVLAVDIRPEGVAVQVGVWKDFDLVTRNLMYPNGDLRVRASRKASAPAEGQAIESVKIGQRVAVADDKPWAGEVIDMWAADGGKTMYRVKADNGGEYIRSASWLSEAKAEGDPSNALTPELPATLQRNEVPDPDAFNNRPAAEWIREDTLRILNAHAMSDASRRAAEKIIADPNTTWKQIYSLSTDIKNYKRAQENRDIKFERSEAVRLLQNLAEQSTSRGWPSAKELSRAAALARQAGEFDLANRFDPYGGTNVLKITRDDVIEPDFRKTTNQPYSSLETGDVVVVQGFGTSEYLQIVRVRDDGQIYFRRMNPDGTSSPVDTSAPNATDMLPVVFKPVNMPEDYVKIVLLPNAIANLENRPLTPGTLGVYDDRAARMLDEFTNAKVVSSKTPERGAMNVSAGVVKLDTGTTLFTKTVGSQGEVDNEVLASRVAFVVGVEGMTVVAVPGELRVVQNIAPGVEAYKADPDDKFDILADIANIPNAKAMGLLDFLVGNGDRNSGNYFINSTIDGPVPYPIDHGNIYWDTNNKDSPFVLAAFPQIKRTPDRFTPPSYTKAELIGVRQRLLELEDDFRALGRNEWYTTVMNNMKFLIEAH